MGDAFSDAYDAQPCGKCGKMVKYPPCYYCEMKRREDIENAKPWEQRYKELKARSDRRIKKLEEALDKLRATIDKAHKESFVGAWLKDD